MTSGQEVFREIGWNGIRFSAPVDWEISRIGNRYLFLENPSGPALEVKWGPVRGRFSSRRHLRRLASLQKKPRHRNLRERPLPAAWEKVLAPFDVRCFSWEGHPYGGIGLVVYCPECRNATLIQFFRKTAADGDRLSARLLESFQDHSADNHDIWAVYDIRATVPSGFRLIRYRLDAGAFRLEFGDRGQKATLYRWAPADVLLRGRSLADFAGSAMPLPPVAAEGVTMDGGSGCQWQAFAVDRPVVRWMRRFSPSHAFVWCRLWRIIEKNRILGIRLEGKTPLEPALMENLCTGYENL